MAYVHAIVILLCDSSWYKITLYDVVSHQTDKHTQRNEVPFNLNV